MISIIVAMDEKRGIGKNGGIPWHIPEDLKRFKAITSGHPVIMGRKTFESIGHPLPNRTNIVVTRDKKKTISGTIMANSLEEAIRLAQGKPGSDEISIIGGGQIYAQAIRLADKLYLTIVEGTYDADTFFPDYSAFTKEVSRESHESDGYKYTFLDLQR